MKIRFDVWRIADKGSDFFIDMEHVPHVGDRVVIDFDLLPPYYTYELLEEHGAEPEDGQVIFHAFIVDHVIYRDRQTGETKIAAEVCLDFGDTKSTPSPGS